MKSSAFMRLALLIGGGLTSPAAMALLTTSSVSGLVIGTFNIGGSECRQYSGLLATGSSASCGLTDPGTQLLPSTFGGTASANAGEVHLQLRAFSSTFGYPGVTGMSLGYRAFGDGSAQFIDSFVITAPGVQVGTPGTLTGTFRVDGGLGTTASGTRFNSPGSQANAALSLALGSVGATPNASMGAGFGTGAEFAAGDIPTSITLVTPFLFGVPIDISAKIAGGASSAADGVQTEAGYFNSEAKASVNYGNTVYWGGIQSVTGANGAPITTFTALSADGFNYAVGVVPEPSALVLMLVGLTAVGARVQRQVKRQREAATQVADLPALMPGALQRSVR
jgi:hypothetical protein